MISCKMSVNELKTVKDYRDSLAESMFHCALNQRYFKISRRKDPPYFSCSSAADVLVRPVKTYMMTATCKEKGTIEALESMLMEVHLPSQFGTCSCHLRHPFTFISCSLIPRLPGFGFMDFQSEKYQLFEHY